VASLASTAMETFIVRVWTPGDGERPEGMRGTAVHLGTGEEITFSDPRRLIAFLGEKVGSDGGPAAAPASVESGDQG